MSQSLLTGRISDPEVFINAISAWGLNSTLKRVHGMFAAAIWDISRNKLTLVRDRLGEKPLVYARVGKTIVFGSTVSSLGVFPGFKKSISRAGLNSYLEHGYVAEDACILETVKKVLPGSYVTFNCQHDTEVHTFWSFQRPREDEIHGKDCESWLKSLHDALLRATSLQGRADTPVGCFCLAGQILHWWHPC